MSTSKDVALQKIVIDAGGLQESYLGRLGSARKQQEVKIIMHESWQGAWKLSA